MVCHNYLPHQLGEFSRLLHRRSAVGPLEKAARIQSLSHAGSITPNSAVNLKPAQAVPASHQFTSHAARLTQVSPGRRRRITKLQLILSDQGDNSLLIGISNHARERARLNFGGD